MNLAPVILFIYNRPTHTEKTLEALSNSNLATDTDLIIFADGPKSDCSESGLELIKQTRYIAKSRKWCKSVTLIESRTNKGLARNIIEGVTEIINKYGKAIILEDDIVTGKYFLEYMNTALDKYKDNKEVMHITGWRDPIKHTKKDNSFFYPTMDCWSWATWADRWQYFKKDAAYYKSIFTPEMIHEFNVEGTDPLMFKQIEMNLENKINTWAIFWYASIFLKNGLCLSPSKSLVKNIGFDNSGVHCGTNPSQEISDSLDNKILHFPEKLVINKREFAKNKKFLKQKNFYKKIDILYEIKCLIPVPLKNIIKKYLKH